MGGTGVLEMGHGFSEGLGLWAGNGGFHGRTSEFLREIWSRGDRERSGAGSKGANYLGNHVDIMGSKVYYLLLMYCIIYNMMKKSIYRGGACLGLYII